MDSRPYDTQQRLHHHNYYPETPGGSTPAQPDHLPSSQRGLDDNQLIQALDRMLTMNQHSFMTRMDHIQSSHDYQTRLISLYHKETQDLLKQVVSGLGQNLEDKRQMNAINFLIKELATIERVLEKSRQETSGTVLSIFDRLAAIEQDIQEIRDNSNGNGNRPASLPTKRDVGTSPHRSSIDLPEKVHVHVAVESSSTSVSQDTDTEQVEKPRKHVDVRASVPTPSSSVPGHTESLNMHTWNFDRNNVNPEITYRSRFDFPEFVPEQLVPAQWSTSPAPAAIDTSIIFAPFKPNNQTGSGKQPSQSSPTVSGFNLDLRSMSPLSTLSSNSEDDLRTSFLETNPMISLKRSKSMSSSAPPLKRSRARMRSGSRRQSNTSKPVKKIIPPSKYDKQYIQCDVCLSWFHYGCVGIVEDDPRLDEDAIFECPRCQSSNSDVANASAKIGQQDLSCICGQHRPNEYFVEKIIGKRMKKGGGGWEWLVKWEGYDYKESSWLAEVDIGAHEKHLQIFLQAAQDEGLDIDDDEDILLSKAAEYPHLWKD